MARLEVDVRQVRSDGWLASLGGYLFASTLETGVEFRGADGCAEIFRHNLRELVIHA